MSKQQAQGKEPPGFGTYQTLAGADPVANLAKNELFFGHLMLFGQN